jgi:hypothetical protein
MGSLIQRRRYWEWTYVIDVEFFVNLKTIEFCCRAYDLPPDKVREYIALHLGNMPQTTYFAVSQTMELFEYTPDEISEYLNTDIYWVRRAMDVRSFKSAYAPKTIPFELTDHQ